MATTWKYIFDAGDRWRIDIPGAPACPFHQSKGKPFESIVSQRNAICRLNNIPVPDDGDEVPSPRSMREAQKDQLIFNLREELKQYRATIKSIQELAGNAGVMPPMDEY